MTVQLVAEIGSNHNGNPETAIRLIDAATNAGADVVKFHHYPNPTYGPHPLSPSELRYLAQYAKHRHVEFLCSVFDRQTLAEYVQVCNPTAIKIASPELTDTDLLHAAASTGLPLILGTGMSTKQQVEVAWQELKDTNDVTLLHCVSSYPAPPQEMNLSVLVEWSYWFKVGLSDHTLDPATAPVAAVALGAVMVEKHFTLNRNQDGPDHSYALEPDEFAFMARSVRLCEQMLGDGEKRVMPSEPHPADQTKRRAA